LAYVLVNAPTGMSISTNGIIIWTPTEAQGPSTNYIVTVATDTNTNAVNAQHLSATNGFVVTVGVPTPVLIEASLLQVTNLLLTISGPTGRDYSLLISTNLVNWGQLMVFTNVSQTPFFFTNVIQASSKARFYRGLTSR
jgi:hypothetical protein